MATLIYVRGLLDSEAPSGRGFRIAAPALASLTKDFTAANSDLVFRAKTGGTAGNAITVAFVNPGSSGQTIGVGVVGSAITVTLGTSAGDAATLTTALAGANNDLTYTAVTPGTGGNSIRVRYVVSGLNTALSVSVAGNDITVNLATDGAGVATSTASQVRTAVLASGPATALVGVALAAGNTGAGVTVALAFTNLAGGGLNYTLSSANSVVTAVQASGPASALVSVSLAPDQDGTGSVQAFGATNLAGGAASGNVLVNATTNVQVDLESASVRKILSRWHDRYVSVPSGGDLVVVRSIEGSEATNGQVNRGFKIRSSAGTLTDLLPDSNAVTVDISKSATRKSLKQHYGRWIVANTSNKLTTIRGLSTSNATGTFLKRGFRIKNQAGTIVSVTPGANVQVDLADPYVRRVLRRNIGRYAVVTSP